MVSLIITVPYSSLCSCTVVLGGDTPLGLPLILGLEKRGFIIIASVSTPEAVDVLERKCHGYVKALVLDPHEVSVSHFPDYLANTYIARYRSRIPALPSLDPFTQVPHHSCG